MRSSSTGGTSSGNGTTISCQDCGNKAKRDCSHMRCRTCCKSRGYHCSTHVKSTWVPVARRRQRQHHQQFLVPPSSNTMDYHHLNLPLSLSRTTSLPHHRTSSGVEGGNFPAEVNSSATFRCIRVSSEDNVVDQYAYQTSINIGGHVFKGILYDQGPTAIGTNGGDQSSSAGNSDHRHHHHQFDIMAATAATAQSGGGANLLYPHHHHPPLYTAPFNAFLPDKSRSKS